MKRYDEFLPYIVVAIVAIAAFFIGDFAGRREISELRAKIVALQSRPAPAPVDVAQDQNCDASNRYWEEAGEQWQKRHDEDRATIEALTAALADATRDSLKAPEPVRPKPTARVLHLPDDASTWYSTLFVQPDWKTRTNEAAAVRRLNETAWGKDLQARTHFRVVDTQGNASDGTKLADVQRYFPWVPQTPCLLIQKPTGEVVYREVNPDLAHDQGGLKRQIDKTMRKQRHHNQPLCPGPYCTPPDQTKTEPAPADEVVVKADDTPPAAPPATNHLPALLAFAGVGGLTYAVKFGHKVRVGS